MVMSAAISPHAANAVDPTRRVRYVWLAEMASVAVPHCDDRVSPLADDTTDDGAFKVVSVGLASDPGVVHRNMVYYNDGGLWTLLVSVDFAQHGESGPPGHWHTNRAPLCELVPHWCVPQLGCHGPSVFLVPAAHRRPNHCDGSVHPSSRLQWAPATSHIVALWIYSGSVSA